MGKRAGRIDGYSVRVTRAYDDGANWRIGRTGGDNEGKMCWAEGRVVSRLDDGRLSRLNQVHVVGFRRCDGWLRVTGS